jgi:hypothetical protein
MSSLVTGSFVSAAVTHVASSTVYREFTGRNYDKSLKICRIGFSVAKTRTSDLQNMSDTPYSSKENMRSVLLRRSHCVTSYLRVTMGLFVDTVQCSNEAQILLSENYRVS